MTDTRIVQELVVKDAGTEKYDLTHLGNKLIESHITEIHHKSDGSIYHDSSFLFVSKVPDQGFVYSQVTVASLNYNLKKIGYEVRKLQNSKRDEGAKKNVR